MRIGWYWIVGAVTLSGCPSSDDAMVGSAGSSSSGPGGSSTEPSSVTNDSSSSTPTTVDTTCSDDCPGTSGGSTGSTSASTSSSGAPIDTSSDGPNPSTEESSSAGPMGTCGDGVVEGTEDCDESGESATCDDDCTFVDCGDENVNQAAGEVCDEGGEGFSCDSDCTLPVCGDGNVNESHSEICDDGGESPGCDSNCTLVSCGDGTQNLAALETCDDGNNISDDGCSGTCVIEGEFGGVCRVVDGTQWCFDDDACGQACDDVCTALGLAIEPDDGVWFAAQDTAGECQAISDAFEMQAPIDFGNHALGCLEDEGLNDLVGQGLAGSLMCSSDPTCPSSHRTDMDGLGTNCNLIGARRSVCPCAGAFCGNGIMEGVEECDDGNQVNNDGCTSGCSLTPPSCVEVDDNMWCFNSEQCGQSCNEVCDSLGLALDISDADWLAAQDTVEECQAIADAFGVFVVDVNGYAYACLEEDGADDIPDMGIQGIMYCSTDASCPAAHRTSADSLGLDCAMGGFRSVCPCN